MEAVVKVGERGQVVIPKEMRVKEGLGPDSYVRVIHVDGGILLRRLDLEPIDTLVAALQASGLEGSDWQQVQRWRHEEP